MSLRHAPQDSQSPTPAVGPEPAAGVARPLGHAGVASRTPSVVLSLALPGPGSGSVTSALVQGPDDGSTAAPLLVPSSSVVPLHGAPHPPPPQRPPGSFRNRRSINASTRSSHR